MLLPEGTPAPDFALPDESGQIHRLSDYRGRAIVLYFYPKDNTPGCTKEACGFRDDYADYQAAGVMVIGVSPDPPERHARFKLKHNLPFVLLSDPEHQVLEKYGAWGLKKAYGREYYGVLRVTYVIDPEGIIRKVYPKVKPAEHSKQVLEDLRAMGLLAEGA
ncbi:MAG TPA: thioredoxin-dependent thiol peroxidase [Anaerolineaceae bacterium]|nr:thioredoxin-dependent thiol peroxidase [Anaerolineaceae bacterium]